jgi:hypothetical protein
MPQFYVGYRPATDPAFIDDTGFFDTKEAAFGHVNEIADTDGEEILILEVVGAYKVSLGDVVLTEEEI